MRMITQVNQNSPTNIEKSNNFSYTENEDNDDKNKI